MVGVEGLTVRVHRVGLFPGFGHEQHHGLRQGVAGHHQKFDGVVQARRIGLTFVNEGNELFDVVAQNGRLPDVFTGADPVVVALDRVDFAVVGDVAVGVRQSPGRERIGREALVHDRQGALTFRILQVAVVAADLIGQQQALVDHRAGAHGGHEVFRAVLEVQGADAVRRALADDVELALERILHHHVRAAADEDLTDDRFAVAHRRAHGHFAVDGHVAPAQNDLTFLFDHAFELLLADLAGGRFARQEDHAHAVFARGGQRDALLGHLFAVKGVGDLNHDPGAVAKEWIGADGAAVVEVVQDQQRVFDDLVRDASLDVGDKPHAAGVVLGFRAIQAFCGGFPSQGLRTCHEFLPMFFE